MATHIFVRFSTEEEIPQVCLARVSVSRSPNKCVRNTLRKTSIKRYAGGFSAS